MQVDAFLTTMLRKEKRKMYIGVVDVQQAGEEYGDTTLHTISVGRHK
jgi:hypothetical protein